MKRIMVLAVVTILVTVTVWPAARPPEATPEGMAASKTIADTRAVDPRAWTELDIVPMPKNIRLTDNDLILNPDKVVLVIGADACKQSKIGADWINQRIGEVGGEAVLPIIAGTELPADKTLIIIGTVEDNPLIARAVAEKIVDVGPNNPGERGYEIRTAPDGNVIYLAGADNIGALYACVTFGELLKVQSGTATRGTATRGTAVWRAAEVRDWPTAIWFTPGGCFYASLTAPELINVKNMWHNKNPSAESRQRYLEIFQPMYDHLLRRKITIFHYEGVMLHGQPFEHTGGMDVMREGMRYGQERGIEGMVLGTKPFVGLVDRYPEAAQSGMGLKNAGPHPAYKKWIRCWSIDDIRRQTAHELAQWVQALGLTHIGFHDTDTGGFENPAQWEERCDVCRRRWPGQEDYAAATVNKHRIYYDEIKKLNPDARLSFVCYPYHAMYAHRESLEHLLKRQLGDTPLIKELAEQYSARYSEFFARLHQGFPVEDMTIQIREGAPAAIEYFRNELAPGRPVFTWGALLYWNTLFSRAPAWTGTFCQNPHDVLYVRYQDEFIPLEAWGVREYSWNPDTPGAEPWQREIEGSGREWIQAEPEGPAFDLILPRLARNFFGAEAGPHVAEAAAQNVSLPQIFGHRQRVPQIEGAERFQWQADGAERAAKALDAAWEKCEVTKSRLGMDEYAWPRFIILRERFHMAMWMAKAKTQNLLARELAMQHDVDAAEQAIADGLEYVRLAIADQERLLAERPDGTILTDKDFNRWAGGWRDYSVDRVDFSDIEKNLEQTRSELAELGALGAMPKHIIDALVENRVVRAHKTDIPVVVDGLLEAEARQKALPVESLLVIGGTQVARAHTRMQLLYDDENLYLLMSAWVPGGAVVADNDTIELFLQTPGLNGDYVHFFLYADGRLRQQYNSYEKIGARVSYARNDEWLCPGIEHAVHRGSNRWDAELKIPLTAIAGITAKSGWKINVARIAPLAGGAELSSLLPNANSFHDLDVYPALTWSATAYPAPVVTLETPEFEIRTETLPDTIASVASFRLELDSDRVLHNVVIEAEAYDAGGKLQRRKTLAEIERVMYRWKSTGKFTMEYQQIQEKGGILLKMISDEGTSENWIRFGGWEGTPQVGYIYAPESDDRSGLRAACYFADRIVVEGRHHKIFNGAAGTLEFWLKPARDWIPAGPGDTVSDQHVFVHYGPMRKDNPRITNNSPLTICYSIPGGRLHVSLFNHRHAGWLAGARIGVWPADEWRHIAVVWDAVAAGEDRLRIYMDGKRVSGKPGYQNKDRLPEPPVEMLDAIRPLVVQIGSLNSGLYPMRGVMADLRVSRIARYKDDFTPNQDTARLDGATTALFSFNGNLTGQGLTPLGNGYDVAARAGIYVR